MVISNLRLRKRIQQLNRINPVTADYNHLKSIYREVTSKLEIVVGMTQSTEMFFRTRVNPNAKPKSLSEIHAPPPEAVSGYQRCNPPGKPMFYAASKRITSLNECSPTVGDKVYLSQWVCREPMPVIRLFESSEEATDGWSPEPHVEIILTHIDTLMTRRVHKTFSDDYKFTAAIVENLISPYTPNSQHDIREDRTVGLRYNSVIDINGGYNTVMAPQFAAERLEPLHVIEAIVIEGPENEITIEILDNAIEFTDGQIRWLNDATKIPLPRQDKKKLIFVRLNNGWRIPTGDSPPSADDILALLKE